MLYINAGSKAIHSSEPDLIILIPDYILKGREVGVITPWLVIFNLSLKSSVSPDCWKCTKVTPIHKKGYVHFIENYMPISLMSSPAKIF